MDTSGLFDVAPPYVWLSSGNEDGWWTFLLAEQARAKFGVRWLRGQRMRTVEGMDDEFAAVLQFPPYFGRNWAALDECLSDLSWLPADAYVLIVGSAEQLLDAEPDDQFAVLLRILQGVGEEWSHARSGTQPWKQAATPFHTVLLTNADSVARVRGRLSATGIAVREVE